MANGAYEVHKEIRTRLEDYIKTQYFGKSPILLEALSDKLDEEGILYKEPFIEASPAYKSVEDGWKTANIPGWMRDFFLQLAQSGLNVFTSPFVHQLKALEEAVAGRDVFVATGTGSGKTECFMWPLLAKMADEARNRKSSWNGQRGIRTIIMYPMNALVTDQLSRLRRLMGDPGDRFTQTFRKCCGSTVRRPQFGMYTGRTPYPGKLSDLKQDKALAKTFGSMLVNKKDSAETKAFKDKLLKDGRIPAKHNWEDFINKLNKGIHEADPEDAELVTRFEIMNRCPDILITNYSMLEYMMIRKREKGIWQETKKWLNTAPENKLLFIIDEAHMYHGSSGGEVALLLRRLLHKLEIPREKVQFILTTASMPSQQPEAIKQFFKDLTGAESDSFCYLTGEREKIEGDGKRDIPAAYFGKFQPEQFETAENSLTALNQFWTPIRGSNKAFESLDEAAAWMYDHLTEYAPFQNLISKCRGDAISLRELALAIFPSLPETEGLQAVGVLLAISPYAKNAKGAVLFPARMHMLFKGITGVYACTNAKCSHGHSANGLSLGELFLKDDKLVCPECHSQVYELYNDRRCGALFLGGYILYDTQAKAIRNQYLWHNPGMMTAKQGERICKIYLFIPEETYRHSTKSESIKRCYLDVKSGFVNFTDDSWEGKEGVRELYYSPNAAKGRPDELTFAKCPHCAKNLGQTELTSFSTRGNQSFYNLIRAQFELEPPVAGKDKDPDKFPNQGRKVLLFSDSRQRAARLAKDMSDASDIAVFRTLLALAIPALQDSELEHKDLNHIYGVLCLEAAKRHLHLFDNAFMADCNNYLKEWNEWQDIDDAWTVRNSKSILFKQMLLRIYSGAYNTVYDTASSWLEPTKGQLKKALKRLSVLGEKVSEQEFKEFFNAWVLEIFNKNMALGYSIPDDIRDRIRRLYERYGLANEWTFSKNIKNIMDWGKDNAREQHWHDVLEQCFLHAGDKTVRKYLSMDTVKPVASSEHDWYRCNTCSSFTPYTLKNRCPYCGSEDIHTLTDTDKTALEFWQKPIENVMKEGKLFSIDTEEHTAQLSYKDQRDDMWSRTEKYELQFQDIVQDNELPVDILSSTTTMEVGVDIGSLVAVGLRNVPPTRENYQQRAGRAGRRGASLSTIVTFCGDNPHDTLYYNNPKPMLRGEPRTPWIDVDNEKLIRRHYNMVMLQAYMEKYDKSMVDLPALLFLKKDLNSLREFIIQKPIKPDKTLLPGTISDTTLNFYGQSLLKDLENLKKKADAHPELFGNPWQDDVEKIEPESEAYKNLKPLLDALYEEGIVPTYSFPKNVVSTYISDENGKTKYQPERGLDIAISDFAPGRAIVVDKNTYQIGGIYYKGSEKRKDSYGQPARKFMDDENYVKEIVKCPECDWFGLKEDGYKACPLCGNPDIVTEDTRMLKPWGFAPVDGKMAVNARMDEQYSYTQQPLYSTVPSADDIQELSGTKNVRVATRADQRIIMINKGPNNRGFMVCPDCGAAYPGDSSDVLKGMGRPYIDNGRGKFGHSKCTHNAPRHINLGYDFKTDMMVYEFALDKNCLDVKSAWHKMAAQSLAEAVRMAACEKLDIDFNELISGYRRRSTEDKVFIDIFLYDSLSSGAGYAVSLKPYALEILKDAEKRLAGCDCDSACHKCLKHYGNQFIQHMLDRFLALDLLRWGIQGKLPSPLKPARQQELFDPLVGILQNDTNASWKVDYDENQIILSKENVKKQVCVYPAMQAAPKEKDKIFISDGLLKYDKPAALEIIKKAMGRK